MGGRKNPACLRSGATAEDRVSGFGAGEASVGLKKIHSAIFCYFFLKKVEEEMALFARRLELRSNRRAFLILFRGSDREAP